MRLRSLYIPADSVIMAANQAPKQKQQHQQQQAQENYVSNLMLQFRELVVGIQEEHRTLKEKLELYPLPSSTSTTLSAHSTGTHATHTPALSPTDEPSTTATISSGTLSTATTTTGSTRPPPYKSVVRIAPQKPPVPPPQPPVLPSRIPPQPPLRLNRKQITNNIVSAPSNKYNFRMSSNGLSRGALIVLEGLDRVGKSTLAKKLVEHLERIRRPVCYYRFPERSTPVGRLIDEFLRTTSKKVDDHAMHLLFSANRWELNKEIRNNLLKGTTVVVDRYSYSGVAYSGAKCGLSIGWCLEMEKGLPKPDLVLFLELPKEAQYRRPGFGDERFETEEMQERVRYQYEQLMDMSSDTWLRVDVENKSPEQVLGEIIVPVKRCLEASASKELGDLDFLTSTNNK